MDPVGYWSDPNQVSYELGSGTSSELKLAELLIRMSILGSGPTKNNLILNDSECKPYTKKNYPDLG